MKKTNLVKELTLGVAVITSAMVLTACGSKSSDKKETKATQTTQSSETESQTEEAVDKAKIIKVEAKDGEFVNVFPEKYNGEFMQVGEYYFGYDLVGSKYADIEDYSKNEYELYFKREGEKESTVIQHFNFGSVSMHSVYSDGKEVLYGCDNKLCRYNIETKKNEEVDLYKTLDNISEKDRNRIYVMGINNGNVYMTFKACDLDDEGKLIGDPKEPIDFIITYNLESKSAKCSETGREIIKVIDEYVITRECINEFKGEEKSDDEVGIYEEKYYVEKATEDGIKEVVEIGNRSTLCDYKDENKKIYFETNIADDEKSFILTSFDKESGKVEKVAEFNTDMFGKGYKDIYATEVTDEDCIICAYEEDGDATNYKNYKYTYATGAIEEAGE